MYCSLNSMWVINPRRMRWAGHVARWGRGVYRTLVGKPEGKRQLGRPRRRREDNINKDLREWDVRARNGSNWLMIGTVGGHL